MQPKRVHIEEKTNTLPQHIEDIFDPKEWAVFNKGCKRFAGVHVWDGAAAVEKTNVEGGLESLVGRQDCGNVINMLNCMVNTETIEQSPYLDLLVDKVHFDGKHFGMKEALDMFIVVEVGHDPEPGLLWCLDGFHAIHPIVTTSKSTLMMSTWELANTYTEEELKDKTLFELNEHGKLNEKLMRRLRIRNVYKTYEQAYARCENMCTIDVSTDWGVEPKEFDVTSLHTRDADDVDWEICSKINRSFPGANIDTHMSVFDSSKWEMKPEFVDAVKKIDHVTGVEVRFFPNHMVKQHKMHFGPSKFKMLFVAETTTESGKRVYNPLKNCEDAKIVDGEIFLLDTVE